MADGLTKPLLGQAFQTFVADLGMRRPRQEPISGAEDQRGAAIATLALVVRFDSAEEESEAGSEIPWICGAILMALGTIYIGQLTYSGVKYCLKRLNVPSHQGLDNHWIISVGNLNRTAMSHRLCHHVRACKMTEHHQSRALRPKVWPHARALMVSELHPDQDLCP